MLTLGHYLKELRGRRTQHDVAIAANLRDHSIVSFIESDKKIRFTSLRKVCRQGLKVSTSEWEMIKLLWLQQQSGESLSLPATSGARSALNKRQAKADHAFLEQLTRRLTPNLPLITRQRLQPAILAIAADPALLSSLKPYLALTQSLQPTLTPNP